MPIRPGRKVAVLAGIVLVVAVAFFASPKGGRVCTTLVKIAGPLDYVFLCDSPRFMEVAANPRLLFDTTRLPNGQYAIRWQTRPLFVLTATVLAVPLAPVLPAIGVGPHPYHLTFVLMNYAIVVLALVLFDRM